VTYTGVPAHLGVENVLHTLKKKIGFTSSWEPYWNSPSCCTM